MEIYHSDHHHHTDSHQQLAVRTVVRPIQWIVVHCSGTRQGDSLSFKALDNYHRRLGWKGCGYHYYITRDGGLWKGRPEAEVGSHAQGYNARSIGVCYEGGLDAEGTACDTRTPLQKLTLLSLLRALKADYPDAEILGHCELPGVQKACPCFLASEEYRNL